MDLVQGCLPVVEGELTNILKVLHKKGNNFFKTPSDLGRFGVE